MCRCLRSTLPPAFSSRFTYILLYICRRRGRAATRQGFNGILFTGFVLRLGKHSLLRPRVCFLPPHPPLSLSLPPSSLFATLPSCCVSQFLGSALTSFLISREHRTICCGYSILALLPLSLLITTRKISRYHAFLPLLRRISPFQF